MKKLFISIFLLLTLLFLGGCDEKNITVSTSDDIAEVSTSDYITEVTTETKNIVSFDSMGGNEIEHIIVDKGSTVLLSVPTKLGYIFQGWYDGLSINAAQYTNGTLIEHNITLYAQWGVQEFTISFETFTENTYGDINVEYNDFIPNLPIPEMDNFLFKGWYIDEEYVTVFSQVVMSYENIVLYAKWVSSFEVIFEHFEVFGDSTNDNTNGLGYEITSGCYKYFSSRTLNCLSLEMIVFENQYIEISGHYAYSDNSSTMMTIKFDYGDMVNNSIIYYWDYDVINSGEVQGESLGMGTSYKTSTWTTSGWYIYLESPSFSPLQGSIYDHETIAEGLADLILATVDNYFIDNGLPFVK